MPTPRRRRASRRRSRRARGPSGAAHRGLGRGHAVPRRGGRPMGELTSSATSARSSRRRLAAEAANRAKSRVPGHHEPRDPHADERRDRHDRAAARHRADAPSSATTLETVHRSAEALLADHQRHPRLLEDRGRQARARDRAVRPARRRLARRVKTAGAARPRQGPRAGVRDRAERARRPRRRHRRGCARSSSTWSATRSSSPSRARSRFASTPRR